MGDPLNDSQIIAAHLAWCRISNYRPSTLRNRVNILERLAAGCPGLATNTYAQIVPWWIDRPLAPDSRAVELAHLRSFYRWAIAEGIRADDPTGPLPRPKRPKRMARPMPEPELARLLALAPRPFLDWLTLAAYSGLRACEIAALRGEHVTTDVLFVIDGKGGKDRTVPLHPRVAELASAWPRRGPVFTFADGRQRTAHGVSSPLSKWLIEQEATGTLHTLRHRFLSEAYAACRDLRAVQDLAGHSSPISTERYVRTPPGVGTAAVLALA